MGCFVQKKIMKGRAKTIYQSLGENQVHFIQLKLKQMSNICVYVSRPVMLQRRTNVTIYINLEKRGRKKKGENNATTLNSWFCSTVEEASAPSR